MTTVLRLLFILSVFADKLIESVQFYQQNRFKYFGVAYKLQYEAQPWGTAKFLCEQEDAKLAVPKSEEEFEQIQEIVRNMQYGLITGADEPLIVWVGISNIDNYTIWMNVDGENIESSGFHTWAGDNGETFSSDAREPHCAGVDAAASGLRTFWCYYRLPFICQITV